MAERLYIPVPQYIEQLWPKGLLDPPPAEGLKDIWMEPPFVLLDPSFQIRLKLLFKNELPLKIPGVEGVQIVFLAAEGEEDFLLEVDTDPSPVLRVVGAPVAIRFSEELLRPARRVPAADGSGERIEVDPDARQVEIRLDAVTLSLDFEGSFSLDTAAALDLPLCLIGETGVAVEAQGVQLFGKRNAPPPGKPEGWRGIFIPHARLYLPAELASAVGELEVTNAYVGNGGFSGSVSTAFNPPHAAQLFGLSFRLKSVALTFVQNALAESDIRGTLRLPFFDEDVEVEIGINLDGGLLVKLSADGGLLALEKPGVLRLTLEGLGFEVRGGVMAVRLSGQLKPLVGGLDWPAVRVRELSIDSEGNVRLEGGWLDLPEQYALDFYGFQLEVTRLGFGKTEDGGKWIGLSGGLRLVEGLAAGASVEGLRVVWYEDGRAPSVTLNGVGVEFEVPGVLYFKGEVAYREESAGVHRFEGGITLQLRALDLELDGKLVVGSAGGSTFLAIYLGVELPAGVPLWTTGLGLYGVAGLYALRMVPGKLPDEQWYENADGSDGWYKRGGGGVSDLKKWAGHPDGMAFGAGITVGTVADNGYTFNGRMLLVISFPGPVLLLEGRANLLSERASLTAGEPLFRALAVLDGAEQTALLALDARYRYAGGGELMDIGGSAEAFFASPDSWHVYLGQKEPRERRLRARVFQLYDADSYFMLNPQRLEIGQTTGWGNSWKFGPLRVTLEAWIEGAAGVSWKPAHFHGSLSVHGAAALRVFGRGLSLSVDAVIAADVFTPFHLVGSFNVGISLPWPLPDFSVGITLEWGPETTPPPLPLPLKEVAVKHLKASTTWPLPRDLLLLPNHDRGDGYLAEPLHTPDENAPPPAGLPVVPLDCRPQLTFGRSVHDDALVGLNAQPVQPEYEQVGDPAAGGPVKVRYGLREVALHKRSGGEWKVVGRRAAGVVTDPAKPEQLYGSWAHVPSLPDGGAPGQSKLLLWSKTPFDYTLHTSGGWDEWFSDKFVNYPCLPTPPDMKVCCDFDSTPVAPRLENPVWFCPEHPSLWVAWEALAAAVLDLDEPLEGHTRGLSITSFPELESTTTTTTVFVTVGLPAPAKSVRITGGFPFGVQGFVLNTAGEWVNPFVIFPPAEAKPVTIELSGKDMQYVVLGAHYGIALLEVCTVSGLPDEELFAHQQSNKHTQEQTALWSREGEVLEPHTTYRLKVVTTVQPSSADPNFNTPREVFEYAYFRTEGPPGMASLSTPVGHPAAEFDSGLGDLSRYVRQTVPPTVPREGERPPLPRPVYRAYDVGVEFNEDYVDLMYRLRRRDLGLYLYSNNNQPARDAAGRLLVPVNRWGQTEQVTLTESEERWASLVNASDCTSLDSKLAPPDKTLDCADPAQVLEPDTFYEARLVPLLLHEEFGGYAVGDSAVGPAGTLGPWRVSDGGDQESPSAWVVGEEAQTGSRFVVQQSNIWGEPGGDKAPARPGTMLLRADDSSLHSDHPEQPGNWTDYRLSLYVRSSDDDAIGVVFRHRDDSNFYRFSMDRERSYRRLVRAQGGAFTVLAEDDFVYRRDNDYLITVEAVGPSLRVYQDGALVFDVTDAALGSGRVGLYCWANEGARFADVRVDDFRQNAPVVYRFGFTTSRFANFFHHLHSFQDETWRAGPDAAAVPPAEFSALAAQAVAAVTAPADEEARAYEALAAHALGAAAQQSPTAVEVTRVERDGAPHAFLVRSPEPLIPLRDALSQEWRRTGLELQFAARTASRPEAPGPLKLTDVSFGSGQPNEESVELLVREPTDLSGHAIQYRRFPAPVAPPDAPPPPGGEGAARAGDLLYYEEFGPQALERYLVVDEAALAGKANEGPPVWVAAGDYIAQTSNLHDGQLQTAVPDKRGTVALLKRGPWADIRVSATLRSDDDDAIGLVFRYRDADNYYRFSADRQRNYRRLVKKEKGAFKTLWEDSGSFQPGKPFEVTLTAVGTRLAGHAGASALFDLTDDAHASGRVGLYCWANEGARFERLEVRRPPLDAYALLRDRFAAGDVNGWTFTDEGDIDAPSHWFADGGALRQTGNINSDDVGGEHLSRKGTTAVAGDPAWTDVIVSVRLQSFDDDALGLLFRYRDAQNFYRFSMDRQRKYRRLVKSVGGVFTALWQDEAPYEKGRVYELTVVAVGGVLRGYMDGVPLFVVRDADLHDGRVGLYCWADDDARFSALRVFPAGLAFGGWLLDEPFRRADAAGWYFVDEGTAGGPSQWKVGDRELRQTGAISDGNKQPGSPDAFGTYALGGDASWTDCRVAVRLRSDGHGAVGVMFRYQDANNYLRLSMDRAQKYRRLTQRVGGVTSVLWEDDFQYAAGREYLLTVDCLGARVAAYMDGVQLFSLEAAQPSAGRVGLYCSANAGARFREVRVAPPVWETYHTFGGGERLPAGARVRVHSGNEAEAPPAAPGAAQRFRATLDERGTLSLSPGGVDLRLVTPRGRAEHARHFLPAGEFESLNARVLRKADGTGFFLFVHGTSQLAAGQYRLRMTYRRDIQQDAPGSQVLKQAGRSEPEQAAIDIPWQTRAG